MFYNFEFNKLFVCPRCEQVLSSANFFIYSHTITKIYYRCQCPKCHTIGCTNKKVHDYVRSKAYVLSL